MVAQGKSSYAHKGMLYAAQVLAGAAIDLLDDPAKVQAAREEFNDRVAHGNYQSLLPADVHPF